MDKDGLKRWLTEIDVRIDWLIERIKIYEEVEAFLLDYSCGLIEVQEAQEQAKRLWEKLNDG